MGFKLGAFAKGFAETAAKSIQADKQNARDTFRIAYSNWLEKSEEETKTRRTKQRELETLGQTMKTYLDMTDAQALKVLEAGPEMAELFVANMLEAKKSMGPSFDVNDVVKASSKTGITLAEGIPKLMGTLDTSGLGEYESPMEGNIFFDPKKSIERERQNLEGAFGQTSDELRAQARGEYITEDLGIEGGVDYGAFYREDPKAALELERLELQVEELRRGDEDERGMKTSDVRSFYSNILPQISGELNVDITYNPNAPEGQRFKTEGGTLEQKKHAMDIARRTVTYLDKLMRGGEYKSIAEATEVAIEYGKDLLDPNLISQTGPVEESGEVEQPADTVDQRGSGADSAESTEEPSNYDPSSGQSPAEFAKEEAERLGLASAKNAVERANIKGSIRRQLRAKGVSENDLLNAVKGL